MYRTVHSCTPRVAVLVLKQSACLSSRVGRTHSYYSCITLLLALFGSETANMKIGGAGTESECASVRCASLRRRESPRVRERRDPELRVERRVRVHEVQEVTSPE